MCNSPESIFLVSAPFCPCAFGRRPLYTRRALADGFLCSRDEKAGKKPNLISRILTRNAREGIYVGPPQADSQILFVRYLDPSFHGRDLATHRTREIAPIRRPSTNNAIKIGHLDH